MLLAKNCSRTLAVIPADTLRAFESESVHPVAFFRLKNREQSDAPKRRSLANW